MDTLLAETAIGISDLKKNPSAVIREAGESAVVVLHHNKPSAYLVPAKTYEAMMDILDDLQLAPLIQERLAAWKKNPDNVITTTIAELEREARADLAAKAPAKRKQSRKRA